MCEDFRRMILEGKAATPRPPLRAARLESVNRRPETDTEVDDAEYARRRNYVRTARGPISRSYRKLRTQIVGPRTMARDSQPWDPKYTPDGARRSKR